MEDYSPGDMQLSYSDLQGYIVNACVNVLRKKIIAFTKVQGGQYMTFDSSWGREFDIQKSQGRLLRDLYALARSVSGMTNCGFATGGVGVGVAVEVAVNCGGV